MAAITVRHIWLFFFSPRVLNILTRGAETQSSRSAIQPGFGSRLTFHLGAHLTWQKPFYQESITKCSIKYLILLFFPHSVKYEDPQALGGLASALDVRQHNTTGVSGRTPSVAQLRTDALCFTACGVLNRFFTPY